MNLKEAYSILGLSETATPEEAKKKYRQVSKTMHPDVNKSPDAEANFKKVNEAYQVISTGKSTDPQNPYQENMGFWDPFVNMGRRNPFGRQPTYRNEHVSIYTTISFQESVLGCKKDLKFTRSVRCPECQGNGTVTLNNGCTKCGGKGKLVSSTGGMIVVQACPSCHGKTQTKSCDPCHAQGIVDAEVSVNVSIPGGVVNGNILNLSGIGNYVGSFGPLEQHTDAHLHIAVTSDPELSLQNMDVITTLKISLKEALMGCIKSVNTINGMQDIQINPLSRNKEEVIIPELGVNGTGNERVILDVTYPDNIANILQALETN